ncbi:hypothetical protein [Phenylobacterium sp.]|uniref:hypothetical protein n=1 Tax=Phenylobacterium sp. TaxID=1871053 RepID=UPI002FC9A3D9
MASAILTVFPTLAFPTIGLVGLRVRAIPILALLLLLAGALLLRGLLLLLRIAVFFVAHVISHARDAPRRRSYGMPTVRSRGCSPAKLFTLA